MTDSKGPSCQICKKNIHKYKCPGCLIRYCSVSCFKDHKETGCCKKDTPKHVIKEPMVNPTTSTPGDLEEGELSDSDGEFTEDKVSKSLLQELDSNPELLSQLQNPHLRNILKVVDSSGNPSRDIHKAMLEPLFTEFSDTCLKVVEPDRCDAELKILKDQCY